MVLKSRKQKNNGFVILYAIVISALLLLIAAGIFSISVKKAVLSSVSSGSQVALYSADAALECALYRDRKGSTDMIDYTTDLYCGAASFPITQVQAQDPFPSGNHGIIRVNIPVDSNLPEETGCAEVVAEYQSATFHPSIGVDQTIIVARGFNICDNNYLPIVTDPRIVERRIRVKFPTP